MNYSKPFRDLFEITRCYAKPSQAFPKAGSVSGATVLAVICHGKLAVLLTLGKTRVVSMIKALIDE